MLKLHKKQQKDISALRLHDKDTGSTLVQIAHLEKRIASISSHLDKFKGDKHSTRGLLLIVEKRRKLLKYAKKNNLNIS
jgi:small subunit ribosomal protein S15